MCLSICVSVCLCVFMSAYSSCVHECMNPDHDLKPGKERHSVGPRSALLFWKGSPCSLEATDVGGHWESETCKKELAYAALRLGSPHLSSWGISLKAEGPGNADLTNIMLAQQHFLKCRPFQSFQA